MSCGIDRDQVENEAGQQASYDHSLEVEMTNTLSPDSPVIQSVVPSTTEVINGGKLMMLLDSILEGTFEVDFTVSGQTPPYWIIANLFDPGP